ncbi:hypothetical protein E2320_003732 [Naja naja]|nr:hypothetical protein E2320_003732 [Naja naja]
MKGRPETSKLSLHLQSLWPFLQKTFAVQMELHSSIFSSEHCSLRWSSGGAHMPFQCSVLVWAGLVWSSILGCKVSGKACHIKMELRPLSLQSSVLGCKVPDETCACQNGALVPAPPNLSFGLPCQNGASEQHARLRGWRYFSRLWRPWLVLRRWPVSSLASPPPMSFPIL